MAPFEVAVASQLQAEQPRLPLNLREFGSFLRVPHNKVKYLNRSPPLVVPLPLPPPLNDADMSAMVALVDHCFCGNPLNLTHDDDEEPSIYCSTQCARQDALDSLSGSGPLHPSSAPPSLTSSASFSSLSSCQSLPSEHNDYNTNADYEVDDLDIPDDEDGVWEFLTPVPAQTLHSDSFVSHYRRVQAQNVPQLPSFEAANFAALTNLSPASPSTTPSQFQSSQARSGAVDVVLESGERFAGSRDSLYSLPEDDECIVDRSRTPRSWGREAATTPLPPFPSNVVWPTTNDNVHFVSRLPVRKERARRHSSVYDYGTVLSRPPGLPLFSKYADSEHDEKDYQSGHSSVSISFTFSEPLLKLSPVVAYFIEVNWDANPVST